MQHLIFVDVSATLGIELVLGSDQGWSQWSCPVVFEIFSIYYTSVSKVNTDSIRSKNPYLHWAEFPMQCAVVARPLAPLPSTPGRVQSLRVPLWPCQVLMMWDKPKSTEVRVSSKTDMLYCMDLCGVFIELYIYIYSHIVYLLKNVDKFLVFYV